MNPISLTKYEPFFIWIGRILIGAITFFMQQMYTEFKELRKDLNTSIINQVGNAKEIEAIKADFANHKEFSLRQFERIEDRLNDLKP